jgi:hypothetical protein
MSFPLTRPISAIASISLLVGGAFLLGVTPAQASPAPVELSLQIAGPNGVFAPVASGAQFAVSSATPTTARWTITNPTDTSRTGYYLYSYGPDCLVSDLTIAAGATYVCTEIIDPGATYGLQNLGALAGIYEDSEDFPISYPLVVNVVDDTNGQSFGISETTVAAQDSIVITGTGFDQGDVLTGILMSTPVDLGPFAITDGAFSYSLILPAGLDAGTHTITLYSNGVAYAARTFVLNAVPVAVPQLSATGVDAVAPLALGGGLFILGAVLTLMTNRKRRTANF